MVTYNYNSGPPYPIPQSYGGNAIGRFVIGVSQIGTIPPFNFWDTIISQYSNSPIMTQILSSLAAALDQTENFDNFYDNIWNVATAQGIGLDIWGRIVNINRVIPIPSGLFFGFEEQGTSVGTFGQSSFYSNQPVTQNYTLSDTAFRQLIYAKALANISDGSVPSINNILMTLFPNRGNAYVTDQNPSQPHFGFEEAGDAEGFNQAPFYGTGGNTNMQIYYVFDFPLQPYELAIVQLTEVLPKPTGVKATVMQNVQTHS